MVLAFAYWYGSFMTVVESSSAPSPAPPARESWDSYFMKLAFMAASRATCPRRSVGALLVQNKRVRGTGYNGSPAGTTDCLEAGCLLRDGSCVRVIHAELNALLDADPLKREGAVMYCTDRPCFGCSNAIANSGVIEVVYARTYHRDLQIVESVLAASGVLLRHYPLPEEWTQTLLNQQAHINP